MVKRSTGNPLSKRWRALNTAELVANDEGERRLSESAAQAGIDDLPRRQDGKDCGYAGIGARSGEPHRGSRRPL